MREVLAGRRGVERVEVERARDQHHAVEADARALQPVGDVRGAGRAVRLADQELGRAPAVVRRQPALDELGERARVLVDAVEVGGLALAADPAEAGAGRVDEDQVGRAEQRAVVRHERRGHGDGAGVVGAHDQRRERAHVQPERRRAGPAVPQERDRPGRLARAVERVGDREDARRRLVLGVAQHGAAGGRGVAQRAAVEAERVVGGRVGRGRQRRRRIVGARGERRERERREQRQHNTSAICERCTRCADSARPLVLRRCPAQRFSGLRRGLRVDRVDEGQHLGDHGVQLVRDGACRPRAWPALRPGPASWWTGMSCSRARRTISAAVRPRPAATISGGAGPVGS